MGTINVLFIVVRCPVKPCMLLLHCRSGLGVLKNTPKTIFTFPSGDSPSAIVANQNAKK